MSPTNVSHAVDRAIARAVAGQPQYAPCVDESLGAALSAAGNCHGSANL